jgi:transglycosylase-like protein with SLT domain/FHA domain-containing protein
MPDQPESAAHPKAWLVSQPGSGVRICHLISSDCTRIGRAPDNELVIQGSDSVTVSLHHLVIERAIADGQPVFRVRDLESTNGTFLNGARTTESDLQPDSLVRLGSQGPELSFVLQEPPALELDQTTAIPEDMILAAAAEGAAAGGAAEAASNTYENLLSEGVKRVRRARAHGLAGQTMTIMRETVDHALRHASRRFRITTAALTVLLVAVSGFATWRIVGLNREKRQIDKHIAELEAEVQKAGSTDQADRLITEINSYAAESQQLQDNLLFRLSNRQHDFVTDEIRRLFAEFGAEVYSVPPEFTEEVKRYIQQYEGPDRPLMARALGSAAGQIDVMRQVLEQQHLPPDLAYVPLVESALEQNHSRAGAAGFWQLTPVTAKAYGLRVTNDVDERVNLVKSTRAACQYLRELILDFGAGSSVMLALAAYNLGPAKVKQAIKAVSDPIKQRNFWYLYRVRALPLETREYVPKVIAAMIIARNPSRFGF